MLVAEFSVRAAIPALASRGPQQAVVEKRREAVETAVQE